MSVPKPQALGPKPKYQVMDQVKKDMEADDKLRKDWEKAQLGAR